MNGYREIVGCKNGTEFLLIRDRMCNQGAFESKRFAWFLFASGHSPKPENYRGCFDSKNSAIASIS